jgi:hypothetical protein
MRISEKWISRWGCLDVLEWADSLIGSTQRGRARKRGSWVTSDAVRGEIMVDDRGARA